MIFSYNWLQSFFKKRLPKPEKLAELLTMYSFEVSEVERVGKDFSLDIDILPNRGPDCFSHLGVAREIAVILGVKFQIPALKLREEKELKAKDLISVEVKPLQVCPRYIARVVTNVKIAPSPKWLKERLKVCGIKPINNVVDIANFVMLETGQPLHAFDLEKLEADKGESKRGLRRKIIVRFAKKRERIVTLDEERYDLDSDILVIADAKMPIAIAGIKGGIIPGIDKKTKIVVLESANFNPRVIRKASKKFGLKTDASWRFEHGIDANLTEMAINRAAFLIQKVARGKVAQGLIDFYPKKVFSKKIKLDLDYVDRLLGIKTSKKEIKNIFKRLGFKISHQLINSSTHQLLVEVPTFRLDINISEDLIEEIGRILGFQKIPGISPLVSLIPPKRNIDRFWEGFSKDILKEIGFTEVYNYSFISQNSAKIFRYQLKDLIEIENPVSLEQKHLRPSLILNLLKNVKENMKNFREIKIFELGKIFRKDSRSKILEKKALTGLMVRLRSPSTLNLSNGLILKKENKAENFYALKGVCDLLLEKMGISNFWYDSYKPTPEESKISIWHPKRCAEIKVDHQEIGFLGEINPKILENFKMPTVHTQGNIVIFDFDFEKLQRLATEEHEFRLISKYPAAIRDIAILVPLEVRIEEVLNKIEISGGSLVRDVDLFDLYTGEEISEGKKNLAFHIIYQSEVKTLSSREVDKIHQEIIKALEEEKGWEVRK